jgi:hypothetical protein
MHLCRCAFEYPAATTSKKSVTDQSETGSLKGDMASGMARDIKDLEIEAEFWKSDGIASLDWMIDCRDIFASRTVDRDLPRTENIVHTTDVVTVMMG